MDSEVVDPVTSRREDYSNEVPPYLQLVVKVSKFCNLRCRYCYEYPSLGNRDAMTVPQVRRMFAHIAEWLRGRHRSVEFVWHGGEPLLMPHSFFSEVRKAQQEILGSVGIRYSNSVQTNLFRLTDEDICLLREAFDEVGVSVDLVGGNRINTAGRSAQPRILTNIQRLIDAGVHFGCITVLSRATAPHVAAIYRFFEDLDLSFRLLPIYRTGFPGQQATHELAPEEIIKALRVVTDLWLRSDSFIRVEPIHSYVANVVHALSTPHSRPRFYDKKLGEVILIIDTDGSVYSNGDAYDPTLRHGDIFTEPIEQMRKSLPFAKALRQSRQRVRDTCTGCKFHGSCSGFFAAEATPEQRWRNPETDLSLCGVALPMQTYVEERLTSLGLVDSASHRLDPNLLEERALR
ncbi:radical SAM protein [Streptomyces hokutonensis]|uniref:radical SAM protein n=1 Tax=Streptomyces hokutonensis TaxID=1306990 RepID=UPI00382EC08B